MEQSPSWAANTSWASQEISRILWNQKVHNRIHKSPPPVSILSHIDSVHAPSHYSSIRFNIILPTTPECSKWYHSLRFPNQNPVRTCPVPRKVSRPAYLSVLDLITRLATGEEYKA